MRNLIRTLLLLLLFAAIFPFVYPWKDGKPMLTWSDLKIPGIPDIPLPEDEPATREPHQPVRLYRWRGAEGDMQFSNEPPPGGVAYEIIEVNPDANLIQSIPVETPGTAEKPAAIKTEKPSSSLPSPLTVSPGQAQQLIEDARNLRQRSGERLRQQEALTR